MRSKPHRFLFVQMNLKINLKSVLAVIVAITFLPVLTTPLEIVFQSAPASPVSQALPGILAQEVYVANAADNTQIAGYNQNHPWPIASLTKVMTVLVFLEQNPDLNKIITLQHEDMVGGSSLKVTVGTSFKADDLAHAALMASANNAVHSLYRATDLTLPEFVQKMNDKAASLGLTQTHFVEPTGLDAGNVSTPAEYAKLISAALDNPYIQQVMGTTYYVMRPLGKKSFAIGNTDRFLRETNDFSVQGAKTGLIDESGFNLAVKAQKDGKSVVAVVFGNSSWDASFAAAKKLLTQAFSGQ